MDPRQRLAEIRDRLQAIQTAAKAAARDFTDSENSEIKSLLEEAEPLKAQAAEIKGREERDRQMQHALAGFGGGILEDEGAGGEEDEDQKAAGSLGEQFVGSGEYKALKSRGLAGKWSSGAVELKAQGFAEFKTTLTEAAGGASLLATPQVRPGILPLLFRRLTIADLIPNGTVDGNLIRYLSEQTFTNAAAPVAEGGTKPESALAFTQTDESITKIAHVLPVSDEMLEDVSAIRSFIDARMQLGVMLTEEDQLLNGSGTAPALRGILNRSGLTAAQPRGTDSNVDAIFKQITTIRTVAFIEPDAIVINPTNWQTIRLSKDNNGQYYGGGPFQDGLTPTLWGLRVVVTPAIAAGTALVGAFSSGAQVFRKGGISIEATNSHNDFFIKDLTMLRAEERLGLAVYRPAGFGTVTGLN